MRFGLEFLIRHAVFPHEGGGGFKRLRAFRQARVQGKGEKQNKNNQTHNGPNETNNKKQKKNNKIRSGKIIRIRRKTIRTNRSRRKLQQQQKQKKIRKPPNAFKLATQSPHREIQWCILGAAQALISNDSDETTFLNGGWPKEETRAGNSNPRRKWKRKWKRKSKMETNMETKMDRYGPLRRRRVPILRQV